MSFNSDRAEKIKCWILLVVILVGQSLAVLWDAELYPFSPYPMYSRNFLKGSVFSQYGIVGVAEDLTEFSVSNQSYSDNMISMVRNPQPLLAESLQFYRRGATTPARGLRLYRYDWQWSSWLQFQKKLPDYSPPKKILIGEYLEP